MALFRLDRLTEYLMALEEGATRESAAPLLGVSAKRLEALLREGQKQVDKVGEERLESAELVQAGRGDPGRLLIQTLRSEARAEQTLVRNFYQASGQSWKAAQMLLERRFPERWAQIARVEAQAGSDPGEIRVPLKLTLNDDSEAPPLPPEEESEE